MLKVYICNQASRSGDEIFKACIKQLDFSYKTKERSHEHGGFVGLRGTVAAAKQQLLKLMLKKSSGLCTPVTIENSIGEFIYNPEEGITFSTYFWRYEKFFKEEHHSWTGMKKYNYF